MVKVIRPIVVAILASILPADGMCRQEQGVGPKEQVYTAKSWKQGPRRLEERTLTVKLDRKNGFFRTFLKDTTGAIAYKLEVKPTKYYAGESLWKVHLTTIEDGRTVLSSFRTGGGDVIQEELYSSTLYPVEEKNVRKTGYLGIPLSAKRQFLIEGFAFTIEVKSYSLAPNKWRILETIEVELRVANQP